MPTISQSGTRVRRLRPGPLIDRDAGDSSPPAGRSPDLRGDLDAESAEPRTRNRLRAGSIAQLAAEPEPARPESVGQRKNFQAASQAFARFLRQNSEAFAQAVEALGDGDASGFAQAWLENYDHRAEEVLNRVAPEARPLLNTDFEAHRTEYYNEAYAVERDRGILAIRHGITSTRQEYLKLVGQEPARLDYAFQKMEGMIRASGLRPDLIEEEVLATRRAIFTSYRLARLAGPNPEALLREMKAGRFEGIVPPEEMEALVVQTAAEVGQRQRAALMERQVDADTRQRLELQRLRAGEGGDPRITPDALRETFPGEVGERKARQLEEESAVAEAYGKYAAASAEERNKALEAASVPDSMAEVAADDVLVTEDSAEHTANGEATPSGPQSERNEAPSEDEATRTPDLQSDSGVDPDALAQLKLEERDQVIGRERGADFQGEPPQDSIIRALLKIERDLSDDPHQHVLKHFPEVRAAFASADALDAQAADPNRAREESAQLKQEAIRQRQFAIGLSLERQRELKGLNAEVRVLSNAQAADMARQIEALPYDQQVARWQNIRDTYGPYADRVLNELMAAELTADQGGTALLILDGASQQTLDSWGRVLGRSVEQLRADVSASEFDLIREGVVIRGREIFSALSAGGREEERQTRFDMMLRLALVLKSDNPARRPDEVVKLAADAFLPFRRISESLLLSKEVAEMFRNLDGANGVERFLDGTLDDLATQDINYDAAAVRNDVDSRLRRQDEEELYADHVRSHGRWRNTCDGVQLVDGGGRPVKYKDGSFVTFTWEQIREGMEAARAEAADKRHPLFRDVLRRAASSQQQGTSPNPDQRQRIFHPLGRGAARRAEASQQEEELESQSPSRAQAK